MEQPDLHITLNLYEYRKVQRPQIFKQNWIILISSSFVLFLLIWAPHSGEKGAGMRGYLGVWEGAPTYTHECVHVHMDLHAHVYMLKYTCKEITNGTNMFIMINMWVCVCAHMDVHV